MFEKKKRGNKMETYNKNIVKEIASKEENQQNLDYQPEFWEKNNCIELLIERLEEAKNFEESWKGYEKNHWYFSSKKYNDNMLKMFDTAKIK